MSTEYDAFGPWVYEVSTGDEVPRLYRDHPVDLSASRLVLKVPRDIVRRDATPDMDLYDHLLVAGAEGLTVLSRQPQGYSTLQVPYDRITAIEHSVDLLDGKLTLHTSAAPVPVTVRYNGSSWAVMQALVRVLRDAYLPGVAPAAVSLSDAPARTLHLAELGERDVSLVTEQHAVHREEPSMALLAAHPSRIVTPVAGRGIAGGAARITHVAYPMTLQGALLCTDGREALVIHRRLWWIRGRRRPVYSVARTVIPVSRVDGLTTADHDRYAGVRTLSVRLGRTVLELPVPAGSDVETALPVALGQAR
ncbi:MAG TPA: hypothetical protein VGK35_10540 [Actinotalea sp.]